MIYQNFDQLIELVRSSTKKTRTVAVVAAQDSHTLEAVSMAVKEKIVAPVLVGHKEQIQGYLALLGENVSNYTIVHAETVEEAAFIAADMVKSGEADFLMKGLIQTGSLMRALLSDKAGFRTGNLISHLGFVQIPNYHKLIGVTDVALNIYPNLNQKKDILENAVITMTRMGFDTPKVAVLAASEDVNPKIVENVDAAELKRMNTEGILTGCVVEGPVSYDLAISKEAAEIKGITSKVCGDVDLMMVPNLAAGNILYKALRYSAGARTAGIVVGGKVPIVLTSRAADVDGKFLPLVLAASATV
ncbi:Phosphate acetyltransferase [Sporomusa silvacetica DSM 10669]|uniref:Phosphate acetyltransferase n=1 Tax=Sporomusa silvacetica DSM 10669 TaxID=1123289 RepID=A0ABZ3ITR5_9FIRM|nr:bifunctional enoyl-CoA hydratase/phosphate acetyltransferase [Sporomusa silvacetica]OZC22319.1 phosphate acetyltransferase [Sporomusa silvacetica DSM 10669]